MMRLLRRPGNERITSSQTLHPISAGQGQESGLLGDAAGARGTVVSGHEPGN
jgi:hypothetical protein